jgi:hypothetical protein
MSEYSIEFNVEEVEKLKRCAQLLHASAGQNEEYQALATWLASICNEEEENDTAAAEKNENESGEPKPKKAKIRKRK